MGYINDLYSLFIFEYDESKFKTEDKITLSENFQRLEFWDKSYTFSYDFRMVPTHQLLDLRQHISDRVEAVNHKETKELRLLDFMTVEEIKLLQYYDYGEEKVYGVVNQIKSHEISDRWEFAEFCNPKDLLHLSRQLLNYANDDSGKPILSQLEVWDELEESNRTKLIEELNNIILLCELSINNGFSLLMMQKM